MLLKVLPFLLAIPALLFALADKAFAVAFIVLVMIGTVAVVAAYAGGQLVAVGSVVLIGSGYLTDWATHYRLIVAFCWLGVLVAFSRERSPQPVRWMGSLRKYLQRGAASPAAFVRILAIYPWLLSCVAFNRFTINRCALEADPPASCAFTFIEFLLWVGPIVLIVWEVLALDRDRRAH